MKAVSKIATRLAEVTGYEDWSNLRSTIETLKTETVRVSSTFVEALVFAEDKRFADHCGVDLIAMAAIPWRIARTRRLSGASTITQQLVRTLTGDRRRCIVRKIREIALAILLESVLSKQQIASVYLSLAYFGWKRNGLVQACRQSGIDPLFATRSQAAEIVARLKYPEPKVPNKTRTKAIIGRRDWILSRIPTGGSFYNATIFNIGEV